MEGFWQGDNPRIIAASRTANLFASSAKSLTGLSLASKVWGSRIRDRRPSSF